MASKSIELGPQLVQSNESIKGSAGRLKKQKSLPGLFRSWSRKSSKSQSRPPSPPTPITPNVPGQYLPSTAWTYSNPGKPSKVVINNEGPNAAIQGVGPTKSKRSSRESSLGGQQELGRIPSGNHGFHGTRTWRGHTAEGGRKEPDVASVTQDRLYERPRMHHSPTHPLLPKGSHLPQPTSRPEPRFRSFSATVHNSQTRSPANVTQSRPAIAVGSLSHNDGDFCFHDPADEAPVSPSKPPALRNPRRELHNTEGMRTSFRSALTNNSSLVNAASTDRSSVATRCTSVSESTVEIYEGVEPKEGGMTADDAIDMYAAGFADDTDSERTSLKNSSIVAVEQRRSLRIAEAINDSMGSELLPPERPSTAASRSSAAIMSGAAFTHESPRALSILPPTSTRDQYGFLKASHYISRSQYDTWSGGYSPIQERRTRKWHSYMRESKLPTHLPSQFPSRSAKTQRYIRKGIPPAWRGPAWFFYAGGETHLQKNPNLYPTLVTRSSSELSDSDKEIIERDLHRTFPDNIHFKPDPIPTSDAPILKSLRNVLRAFSLHCPRIGYCQSLNFIAGLLLLFLPEENTFWMLHIITTTHLPGTHDISLEGANVDLWVLMTALKESLPSIWTKVSSGDDEAGSLGVKLPPISLCTTSWFMSLFIGTLPIESVLRVWDVLFYEGSRTLFRIAIAIFRLGEQRIKGVNESMEMFQVVQGLPREMVDVGLLMNVALKRGGASQEWVERKRWERRRWYAKERARVRGVAVAEEGVAGYVKPRRAESLWRRRGKQRSEMG